jgi:3-oxoadipate enol-lactonase
VLGIVLFRVTGRPAGPLIIIVSAAVFLLTLLSLNDTLYRFIGRSFSHMRQNVDSVSDCPWLPEAMAPTRALPDTRGGSVPTFARDGATIHYTDSGAPSGVLDAATVFFGHGLLFSAWMFHHQIAALKSEYRCVAIDWRGQGDSPAVDGGYDMDDLTEDAIALIDLLGVAPVHYVGLSMGGFVGLRIAARRGELLRSLTLLDTGAGPEEPDKARRYKLMAGIYRLTGILPLSFAVARIMFGPSFLADASRKPVIKEWERRLKRCRRSAISRAVVAVANRQPVETEVTSISVPTQVIVGADDVAIPPFNAERLAARIPAARLEMIPDCGHSSTLEQPQTITKLLREFLAQHR